MKFSTYKLLTIFLLAIALKSSGQSLIVGIPSADVTHEGKFEWTHESQLANLTKSLKWNSFNFLTYGLCRNTEISVSLNNLGAPSGLNEAIGVGVKRVFLLNKTDADFDNKNHHFLDHDFRWTVGGVLNYSIPREKPGYWLFSHLSYRLPYLHTRLTGGITTGNSPTFGYRPVIQQEVLTEVANYPVAAMLGIEQPITENLSLIADWYSGTHDLACFIPALQYELEPLVMIVGYKIPNNPESGAEAVVLETMLRF